jgi:hypothetical protein
MKPEGIRGQGNGLLKKLASEKKTLPQKAKTSKTV